MNGSGLSFPVLRQPLLLGNRPVHPINQEISGHNLVIAWTMFGNLTIFQSDKVNEAPN